MNRLFIMILLTISSITAKSQKTVLLEAENFARKGGWVVDQQFMDQMGSPFLMAHGMGIPVNDASTQVQFPETGKYRLFVRTRNWAARWTSNDAPENFRFWLMVKLLVLFLGLNQRIGAGRMGECSTSAKPG